MNPIQVRALKLFQEAGLKVPARPDFSSSLALAEAVRRLRLALGDVPFRFKPPADDIWRLVLIIDRAFGVAAATGVDLDQYLHLSSPKEVEAKFEHLQKMQPPVHVPESPEVLNDVLRPDSTWRHYKGGVYEIVTQATVEATGEQVVVYRNNVTRKVWTRPLTEFMEDVLVNGVARPRFEPYQ